MFLPSHPCWASLSQNVLIVHTSRQRPHPCWPSLSQNVIIVHASRQTPHHCLPYLSQNVFIVHASRQRPHPCWPSLSQNVFIVYWLTLALLAHGTQAGPSKDVHFPSPSQSHGGCSLSITKPVSMIEDVHFPSPSWSHVGCSLSIIKPAPRRMFILHHQAGPMEDVHSPSQCRPHGGCSFSITMNIFTWKNSSSVSNNRKFPALICILLSLKYANKSLRDWRNQFLSMEHDLCKYT